jgi:hypothetical protein
MVIPPRNQSQKAVAVTFLTTTRLKDSEVNPPVVVVTARRYRSTVWDDEVAMRWVCGAVVTETKAPPVTSA